MKVDYNKCSLNIISSIEYHYGYDSAFARIDDIVKKLDNKKHIFLLLFDGLGLDILLNNLKEEDFLRKHLYDSYTTLFPPTTSAVTNSLLANKLPRELGWFGWHQYFSEFDRDIIMFKNQDYYTHEYLDVNIRRDVLPYDNFFEKYQNSGVETSIIFPKHIENGKYRSIRQGLNILKKISLKDNDTFTYFYCVEPDNTIHKYGCYHKKTKKTVNRISKRIEKFTSELSKDSICLIISDHGLIDVKNINLYDIKDIRENLVLKPSIESRTTTFKVKDKDKFKNDFNKLFKDHFMLFSKEEFLNSDYAYILDKAKSKLERFIFDFVSISIDEYSFVYYDKKFNLLKAHHAGSTEKEMIIPLIIVGDNDEKDS